MSRFSKFAGKVQFFLWPPLEARQARLFLERDSSKVAERHTRSIKRAIAKHLQEEQAQSAETWAKLVFDSENDRRVTIESKATSYLLALGLSVGLISVIPLLFGDTWDIPLPLAVIAGFLYILTIVYFMVAVWFAIQVRRVTGIRFPSADEFVKSLRYKKLAAADRIKMYITIAKLNEPGIIHKSNCLVVAEKMFLRGLILFAFAAGITIFSKLYTESTGVVEQETIAPLKQIPAQVDSLKVPAMVDSLKIPAVVDSTTQDSLSNQ